MKVVILGAGTAVPQTGHSPAGIYVSVGGEHLLLDAGAGTLQRLHSIGVTLLAIDKVFLTHYHIDHCLDLVSLLFALRIPRLMRKKPLSIYGPRGLKKLYRDLDAAFHGWLKPRGYRLLIKELGEGTLRFDRYTVTAKKMDHYQTGALGYRIAAKGKSVAYSGDTDYCPAIVALGRRCDLLILECSVTDKQKVEGHLTPSECGRIAAEADCRHLALTHFYPVFKGYPTRGKVRRFFKRGRITLARDFTRILF